MTPNTDVELRLKTYETGLLRAASSTAQRRREDFRGGPDKMFRQRRSSRPNRDRGTSPRIRRLTTDRPPADGPNSDELGQQAHSSAGVTLQGRGRRREPNSASALAWVSLS